MSYDIPDEIKYKEKIVFGLGFKQLGYLCVFGLLAFFSYSLPFGGIAKLILPIFFMFAGIGFVFLNLEERAFDAYYFLTGVRFAKAWDAKAQEFVGVSKIDSGLVFLKNGSLRAIIQVDPVNYGLLEESQRKALVLNYREFLNHLTTSVQILVKTSKPNLSGYFAEGQARMAGASSKLRDLFDDFQAFEQKFLEDRHVRERTFYLVVAQESRRGFGRQPDPKEAEKLLEEKARIIQEKLLACGLKSRRLQTDELLGFYAKYSSQEADSSEEKTNEEAPQAIEENGTAGTSKKAA